MQFDVCMEQMSAQKKKKNLMMQLQNSFFIIIASIVLMQVTLSHFPVNASRHQTVN